VTLDTLYLTAGEQSSFDALDTPLKEGWKINEDVLTYIDNPHRRRIRMQAAHIHDKRLKDIQKKFRGNLTLKEMSDMISVLNLSDMNERDVRELLYAFGPDVLSGMIILLLKGATTDNDIREAAAYSTARHLFFAADGQ
jgi:hypothetical protein